MVEALRRQRIDVAGYDFLVVVNPDPSSPEGGASYPGSAPPWYIYLGNFSTWTTPLTQANLTSIANAAYHHEIGHYWGWRHDWTCMYEGPFISEPALFGWTDTGGDGTPEIIDPTPYGTGP